MFTKFEKVHLPLVSKGKFWLQLMDILGKKLNPEIHMIILRKQDQIPGGGCSGRIDLQLINARATSKRPVAFSPELLARSPPEELPCKSY